MPTGGPFPNRNADVNDYFDTGVPYLNTNQARLKITNENINPLNDFYDKGGVAQNLLGWKQLWPLYSNEDTVTSSIRKIVKTRRAQMEKQLRLIYNDIPESVLTENDRTTLNLPARDTTPTPIQPMTVSPLMNLEEIHKGVMVLRFRNPLTPDSDAVPEDQVMEIQQFVGEGGLADNAVPFVPLRDWGKHLLAVKFTPDQKGKTAYFRSRYKTPTGETGPWSEVLSEIVL